MIFMALVVAAGMCGQAGDYAPNTVIVKWRHDHAQVLSGQMQHRFRSGAEKWKVDGDVMEAVESLNRRGDVEYAEPDYILHADYLPNDPYLNGPGSRMQNLRDDQGVDADISYEQALDIERGDPGVVIGDIDTGCDYNNPDLGGCIGPTCKVIGGYDFDNEDPDPMDDNGHGTHTAGTAAATTDNGIAVAGVCPNCSIECLKFLNCGGSGTTTDAIRAIDFAAGAGLRVLNNSWGGGPFSQALLDAIISWAAATDGVFVASAGNNNRDTDLSPAYPADFDIPNIISVGASDPNDMRASFSNWGRTSVDLFAPGVGINSTWRLKDCRKQGIADVDCVGSLQGTSMSAPHVTGAVGMLLSQDPSLTAAQIKARILATVDPVAAFAALSVSGGRLNLARALGVVPPQPTEFCGNALCVDPEDCMSCEGDCPRTRGKRQVRQCCGNERLEPGETGTLCDGNP